MGSSSFRSPRVLLRAATAIAEIDDGAVLAGGYALQLFGSRRLTTGVDVVAASIPEGLPLTRRLRFGGIKTRVAGVPTKIIVRDDDARGLYEAAREAGVAVPDVPLRVVPPAWMVALKLYAGRAIDLADIETILGWEIERQEVLSIARRHLGILAAKKLGQIMTLADWRRESATDSDEE
ncbi:MAG: hypothetical protein H6719_08795 [Sandaracinaceae bacterium]|nr:hypothetical protein [Sandaracinaceae bacterium]